MKYLKLFEDVDTMGGDTRVVTEWISVDDLSEALYGLVITCVEVCPSISTDVNSTQVFNNKGLRSEISKLSSSDSSNPCVIIKLSNEDLSTNNFMREEICHIQTQKMGWV